MSFILAIGLGASVVVASQLSAFRKRSAVAAGQVAIAFGRGLLAIPAIWFWSLQAAGAVLAYIVSVFLTVFVQFSHLRSREQQETAASRTKPSSQKNAEFSEMIPTYMVGIFILTALDLLVLDFDKLVFSYVLTIEQIGILVAVQQIAKAGPVLVAAITEQYLFPIQFGDKISNKDGKNDRSAVKSAGFSFAVAVVPLLLLSVIISAVSEPLIRLFLSDAFLPGAKLLPWLLAGYALTQCARLLHLPGLDVLRTRQIWIAKLAQAIAFFSIFAALVSSHGLLAAGYALFGSSVVLTAMLSVANLRLARQQI